MKARLKATGEIVTITGTDGICLTDENGNYHLIRDLEGCEAMPDYWEKLKHQYAGMAMQGLLSNSLYLQRLILTSIEDVSLADEVTMCAYDYATTLINKLKEESQCEK